MNEVGRHTLPSGQSAGVLHGASTQRFTVEGAHEQVISDATQRWSSLQLTPGHAQSSPGIDGSAQVVASSGSEALQNAMSCVRRKQLWPTEHWSPAAHAIGSGPG